MISHATPTRSPDLIFANPVTPVIIDSSPCTKTTIAQSNSPLSVLPIEKRCLLTPKTASAGWDENTSSPKQTRALGSRSVLGTSPGRKNIPLSRETHTYNEGKEAKASCKDRAGEIVKGILAADAQEYAESGKSRKRKNDRRQKGGQSKNLPNSTLEGKITKPVSGTTHTTSTRAPPGPIKGTPPSVPQEEDKRQEKDTELFLDQATKRRDNWTPAKNSLPAVIDLAESDSSPAGNHFKPGSLLADYGYTGLSDTTKEPNPIIPEGNPTKKRRMEVCYIRKYLKCVCRLIQHRSL